MKRYRLTNCVFPQCRATTRMKGALAVCLALWALALAFSGTAWGATLTPFDAPGAGTGAQQGTIRRREQCKSRLSARS
jgi:hypothetical protein